MIMKIIFDSFPECLLYNKIYIFFIDRNAILNRTQTSVSSCVDDLQ